MSRVAIVTGGTRGIGEAIAVALVHADRVEDAVGLLDVIVTGHVLGELTQSEVDVVDDIRTIGSQETSSPSVARQIVESTVLNEETDEF